MLGTQKFLLYSYQVKVLLKVFQGGEVPGSCRVLSVDDRRRCVTLYDPATPTTSATTITTSLTPTNIIQNATLSKEPRTSLSVTSTHSSEYGSDSRETPITTITQNPTDRSERNSIASSDVDFRVNVASGSSLETNGANYTSSCQADNLSSTPTSALCRESDTKKSIGSCAIDSNNCLSKKDALSCKSSSSGNEENSLVPKKENGSFSNNSPGVGIKEATEESYVCSPAESPQGNPNTLTVTTKKGPLHNSALSGNCSKEFSVVNHDKPSHILPSQVLNLSGNEEAQHKQSASKEDQSAVVVNGGLDKTGPTTRRSSQLICSNNGNDNLCSATIKGVSAPKMFTFDGVYTHDDSQVRICANLMYKLLI